MLLARLMCATMFEGLMNQDADGTLIPGVATGYEVSDDGLVYTFTLRDNAKWSNGDPVTAGDFEYAWKRAASPELASPFAWYLELMAIANFGAVNAGQAELDALGVAATDDLTLKVTLAQPLSYFPQMVVHTTTFPVHQATVEAHGTDWTKPEKHRVEWRLCAVRAYPERKTRPCAQRAVLGQ